MIYLPRVQPKVNKSHFPEVPKNNRLIFFTLARYQLWGKMIRNTLFFVCFNIDMLKKNKYFSGLTVNNSKKVPKVALGFPYGKNL